MTNYFSKGNLAKISSILIFSAIIIGCQTKKEFSIRVLNHDKNTDSVFIKELTTDKILAKIPLNSKETEFRFSLERPTIGSVYSNNSEQSSMVILQPNSKTDLRIDSTFYKSNDNLADSLINFLHVNTNESLGGENAKIIFGQDNPEKVIQLFDSLSKYRTSIIESFKDQLSNDESEILHFYNEGRINAFLLFYGRMIKKYEPRNPFFAFIKDMDNENNLHKIFPNNLLYKYEIEFLNERDSIDDIKTFLNFIEAKTTNKDLASFLKAIYLKNVIQHPSYWEKHEQLFTSTSIEKARKREKENPYSDLMKSAFGSYFSLQQGVDGYNFVAYDSDSIPVTLSDFKGKLVFIDVWATWCGPCVRHRPNVLKLAEKYKDNENIEILMISVDSSEEKWKKYINKTNKDKWGKELMIQDGMRTEFGDKYLVKAIPKYILIDGNGTIINSKCPEPSIALETMIDKELNKMLLVGSSK